MKALTPKMHEAMDRLEKAGKGWHSLASLEVSPKTAEGLENRRLVL